MMVGGGGAWCCEELIFFGFFGHSHFCGTLCSGGGGES